MDESLCKKISIIHKNRLSNLGSGKLRHLLVDGVGRVKVALLHRILRRPNHHLLLRKQVRGGTLGGKLGSLHHVGLDEGKLFLHGKRLPPGKPFPFGCPARLTRLAANGKHHRCHRQKPHPEPTPHPARLLELHRGDLHRLCGPHCWLRLPGCSSCLGLGKPLVQVQRLVYAGDAGSPGPGHGAATQGGFKPIFIG